MGLFIAYVSGSQTLAHVIWNHLKSMLKYRLLGLNPKSFLFNRSGLGPENLLF